MADANEAYSAACADLIAALIDGRRITETSLETLVDDQADPSDRKRLIVGLKAAGLISADTAAWAIGYRWPLKKA